MNFRKKISVLLDKFLHGNHFRFALSSERSTFFFPDPGSSLPTCPRQSLLSARQALTVRGVSRQSTHRHMTSFGGKRAINTSYQPQTSRHSTITKGIMANSNRSTDPVTAIPRRKVGQDHLYLRMHTTMMHATTHLTTMLMTMTREVETPAQDETKIKIPGEKHQNKTNTRIG